MTLVEQLVEKMAGKVAAGNNKNDHIKHMGTWACPQSFNFSGFVGQSSKEFFEFENGAFLLVDKGPVREEILNHPNKFSNINLEYDIFKTTKEGLDDYTIIGNHQITDVLPLEIILCSAHHLIKADMKDSGPLFGLSFDNNQENMNLGYYYGEHNKLKMVFVERKWPEINLPREYHIHESDAPRDWYKANRYFLIPKK